MDLEKDGAIRLSMTLMGEAMATKRLLKMLILSHPDAEMLSVAWNTSLKTWLERERESALCQMDSFRDALESSVDWMTRSIEEAQRKPPTGAGIH